MKPIAKILEVLLIIVLLDGCGTRRSTENFVTQPPAEELVFKSPTEKRISDQQVAEFYSSRPDPTNSAKTGIPQDAIQLKSTATNSELIRTAIVPMLFHKIEYDNKVTEKIADTLSMKLENQISLQTTNSKDSLKVIRNYLKKTKKSFQDFQYMEDIMFLFADIDFFIFVQFEPEPAPICKFWVGRFKDMKVNNSPVESKVPANTERNAIPEKCTTNISEFLMDMIKEGNKK